MRLSSAAAAAGYGLLVRGYAASLLVKGYRSEAITCTGSEADTPGVSLFLRSK